MQRNTVHEHISINQSSMRKMSRYLITAADNINDPEDHLPLDHKHYLYCLIHMAVEAAARR